MKEVIKDIRSRLRDAAVKAFGDQLEGVEPTLNEASNPTFGDFQSNVALTLSKQLKLPPRAIAEQIVKQLALDSICEEPTVAGPGFINMRLTREFLEKQVNLLNGDDRLGVVAVSEPRTVVIDMSSPNIAKEMHVGHLRSTIIGEALSRTIAFLGHNVQKVNHVGDWGTQFGMLITQLKDKFPSALSQPDALDLGDLVTFYKEAKKRFDEDESFQNVSREEVVRLQAGDPDSLKAWQLLCQQSRKAFQEIYDTLDVHDLVERGESFYNPYLAETVKLLVDDGIAKEDQGAICVFLDGYQNEEGNPLPLIIQKKGGGFNYATTDLACVRYRVNQQKADELIYLVDAGQATHFEMMLKVARLAGFLPVRVKAAHVPFGLVLGEDGKKLKTRSGENVRLRDLLDEAVLHARENLDARLTEKGKSEPEEFKNSVSRAIGIGAVKYADLSLNRITNYTFSFSKMLSLQGNTAPYMMYAYVRVHGISREGGIDLSKLGANASVSLDEKTELELAKQLLKLDVVLQSVSDEFLPNRICEYLFELSQKFNQFYENCPVLNAPEPQRTSRLLLCDLTARTLKLGLTLLGIPLVERM
jgi:arginyl-tRNA synthetase